MPPELGRIFDYPVRFDLAELFQAVRFQLASDLRQGAAGRHLGNRLGE